MMSCFLRAGSDLLLLGDDVEVGGEERGEEAHEDAGGGDEERESMPAKLCSWPREDRAETTKAAHVDSAKDPKNRVPCRRCLPRCLPRCPQSPSGTRPRIRAGFTWALLSGDVPPHVDGYQGGESRPFI